MTGRGGQAKHVDTADQRISTLQWPLPAPSRYLIHESARDANLEDDIPVDSTANDVVKGPRHVDAGFWRHDVVCIIAGE